MLKDDITDHRSSSDLAQRLKTTNHSGKLHQLALRVQRQVHGCPLHGAIRRETPIKSKKQKTWKSSKTNNSSLFGESRPQTQESRPQTPEISSREDSKEKQRLQTGASALQIKEIEKEDFVLIGNHSHSHKYLTDYKFEYFKKDIDKSIKIFKNKLAYNPIFFSYPFGEYSLEQKNYINQKFDYAFGQHSGVIDLNKDNFEDNDVTQLAISGPDIVY